MIKNVLFGLFGLLLLSCNSEKEKPIDPKPIDPIYKSKYILETIYNDNFMLIQKEYLSLSSGQQDTEGINELCQQISDSLKKYGLPKVNQYKIVNKDRWPIPTDDPNADSIHIYGVEIEVNRENNFAVRVQIAMYNNEPKLLSLGLL